MLQVVNSCCRPLHANAQPRLVQGKLDPVHGRSKEIAQVIEILGRRTKSNPCLIGEPGVGKTAVAEGLAQLIVDGQAPETLADRQVVAWFLRIFGASC